jgi:carbon monoxide dehydrogenase subunit G
MLLKDDVTSQALRKRVWDFLTNLNQIGQYVSGVGEVEAIEKVKRYHGVVSFGWGSVKAHFSGEIDILELDEPYRAKLNR